VLAAFNGRIPLNFDVKILGSDIDTNMLKKARSGRYDNEELKEIDRKPKEKYFDRISPAHYQVKEELRKHVGFRRLNLVHDAFRFKHKIDIVFCRNVVIYFDNETRRKVYRKFHKVLNDPGYFFSGHSENLFSYGDVFAFIDKSVYKKVV
jgi:chemotaxis protein methyltransferase CheR